MKKNNWIWAVFALCLTLIQLPLTVQADDQTPAEQFRVGMEAGYAPFNWTQTTDANQQNRCKQNRSCFGDVP